MAVTDEAIKKIKASVTSAALDTRDRLSREADLVGGLELSQSSLPEAVRACLWSTSWTYGAATDLRD